MKRRYLVAALLLVAIILLVTRYRRKAGELARLPAVAGDKQDDRDEQQRRDEIASFHVRNLSCFESGWLSVVLSIDLELTVRDRILIHAWLCAVRATQRRSQLLLERLDELVVHRLTLVMRIAQVDETAKAERVDVRARHDRQSDCREPEAPSQLVVRIRAADERLAAPVHEHVGVAVPGRELLHLAHRA